MDDATSGVQSSNDATDELGQITEDVYRKNIALDQTNKTLSLLRKIDEIVLSSVTDPQAVAQSIADLTAAETGYKEVQILVLDSDKGILRRIGVAETDGVRQIEQFFKLKFTDLPISLAQKENSIVKAFTEKAVQVSHDLYEVLCPTITKEQSRQMQEMLSIITITIHPLIARGSAIGALVLSLDMSENNLNKYQHDLRERLPGVIGIALNNALLYQEIQQANEKLKVLDKLKDEFVSLASHELRTPMTAIKSYLWMALAGKGGQLNDKQKYYLDRAYNSTDRLIQLVNDMLNVSRIESGRISLEQKALDINALIDDVIADITPRSNELGVHVAIQHDTNVPLVFVDENKIKEVCMNLVGNSLKFTPKDGTITISFLPAGKMVEVSVSDTGKGIAQEDIPKLFQKFGKIDNTYATIQNVQGTGLGLYISKAIIELHKGKIWATSPGLEKGTTVTFSLPVYTDQEEKNPENSEEKSKFAT